MFSALRVRNILTLLIYLTESHQDTTDRHIYAKKVVPQSLRAYPPAWYWVGSTSGIVWFMDIFGFRTAWVSSQSSFEYGSLIGSRIIFNGLSLAWESCRERQECGCNQWWLNRSALYTNLLVL